MAQNIMQAAGTRDENKVSERLIESLERHADNYGVGINVSLKAGLQDFFTELIEEEREGASYDGACDGLTAEVLGYLGAAMQRLANDIEGGDF